MAILYNTGESTVSSSSAAIRYLHCTKQREGEDDMEEFKVTAIAFKEHM